MVEQQTISIGVECATGADLPAAVEARQLPAGAVFHPESRTIEFTPGLDQAGVYRIELAVAGIEEAGVVEVQVADAFDSPGNVPVNPATYTEEYGLPVVHLGLSPDLNPEEYTPATIVYRGRSYEGAEAKYRGATSLRYPKKSYTLKFAKSDRFSDLRSAAGFSGKRKLTLTTTFDDNSYLRARLAFRLWNSISADNIQVEAFSVVVFVGGVYQGVYTLTDHIDRHLMEDNHHFEDGNLYKARTGDANFRLTTQAGALKPALSVGYEKTEGTPLHGEPGAYADLEDLVQWVSSSSREGFLAELDTRLAREEYEAWWMLVGFIAAGDSAGKNSYHYRDPRPAARDARFHCVPWDFNDSFGQSWRSTRRAPDSATPVTLARFNLLFERLLAEPETREPMLARFRALLDGPWAAAALIETVDAWAAEIQHAARRDERWWGADYAKYYGFRTDLTTFDGELEYLRQWIVARHDFIRNVQLEQPLLLDSAEVMQEPPAPEDSGSFEGSGALEGSAP